MRGACPRGHPQRVARTRGRRRGRWPILVVLLGIAVAAGYLGLVWYPFRAAEALMRPTSSEYARALEAYRAAVDAVPEPDGEPEEVIDSVDPVLARAQEARDRLAQAQISLEERTAVQVPVVSGRPPLGEALDLRESILAFYTGGLETVGRLDAVARYLSGLSGALTQLEDLEQEFDGVSAEDAGRAMESAQPVAEQLNADLEALTPPDELGAVHSALEAIANRIQADLRQIAQTAEQGGPVVEALLADVEAEIDAFRQSVAEAPVEALRSGLGSTLKTLTRRTGRINEGLAALRADGLAGIVVPPPAPS
ncbi:MAG TPA: hypothetical protein VHL78_03210 [Actinomycetota bacterium]|nr:hypothetical protein [Actinomycetota bacterium]